MKTMQWATGFLLLALVSASCSKAPVAPAFGKRGQGDVGGTGGGGGGGGAGGEPVLTEEEKAEIEAQRVAEEKLTLALTEEFESFTKSVDEVDLKTVENAGKVPALIVKSQVNLGDILEEAQKEEPVAPKGRCMVFASGDKTLSAKDIASSELVLSPGAKFIYTESAELEPADCQKLFKEKLAERYKTDFFNLHEAFYSVR